MRTVSGFSNIWIGYHNNAVFLSKISPMLHFNINHSYFFYFGTWISLIFLEFCVVFTNLLAGKFETLVVFMKWGKKKLKPIWRPGWARGPPLRPPLRATRSAPASAPALGPSLGTRWVSTYFISAFHETTKVSNLLPKDLWNHPKFQK